MVVHLTDEQKVLYLSGESQDDAPDPDDEDPVVLRNRVYAINKALGLPDAVPILPS